MLRVLEFLPVLMMFEALVAGIVYACFCEWNKALYWVCASLITFSVLRMQV